MTARLYPCTVCHTKRHTTSICSNPAERKPDLLFREFQIWYLSTNNFVELQLDIRSSNYLLRFNIISTTCVAISKGFGSWRQMHILNKSI